MWTFGTDRQEHLDEHNQYDHADLSSLTEGKVLGVLGGIIKQVDQTGGGSGGMPVSIVAGNATVTAAGIWIMDSAAAIRTVTLPLISATTVDGMRVIIKREGANFVDVDCAGTDEFEPGGVTTQRLFTNWSALSLVANTSANYWYELGYFGSIT